jgi:hypothetical protein
MNKQRLNTIWRLIAAAMATCLQAAFAGDGNWVGGANETDDFGDIVAVGQESARSAQAVTISVPAQDSNVIVVADLAAFEWDLSIEMVVLTGSTEAAAGSVAAQGDAIVAAANQYADGVSMHVPR